MKWLLKGLLISSMLLTASAVSLAHAPDRDEPRHGGTVAKLGNYRGELVPDDSGFSLFLFHRDGRLIDAERFGGSLVLIGRTGVERAEFKFQERNRLTAEAAHQPYRMARVDLRKGDEELGSLVFPAMNPESSDTL